MKTQKLILNAGIKTKDEAETRHMHSLMTNIYVVETAVGLSASK